MDLKQAPDEIWTIAQIVAYFPADHAFNMYGFFAGAVVIGDDILLYSLN